MNIAKNDTYYESLSVDQVCAGYETAIIDYEQGQSSLKQAAKALDLAGVELEYARLSREEADVQLEVVVLEFNASHPDDSAYPALMAELDLASDHMFLKTEECELAEAKHQLATECYQAELASSSEKLNVATALRTELVASIQELAVGDDASNDAYYSPEQTLNGLSDNAYRFFKQAA